MQNNVVFLDRDGVINYDSPNYIKNWSEFKFLPNSINAIQRLTDNNFKIIIITNQSGLARKFFTQEILKNMHTKMTAAINAGGGKILDIFFCPHHPDDNCECRKPKPGLIFQAQKKYNIDLSKTYMVGDSVKDIECGQNAGCGQTILVKTGNYKNARKILNEKNICPSRTAQNLYNAAGWIISNEIG